MANPPSPSPGGGSGLETHRKPGPKMDKKEVHSFVSLFLYVFDFSFNCPRLCPGSRDTAACLAVRPHGASTGWGRGEFHVSTPAGGGHWHLRGKGPLGIGASGVWARVGLPSERRGNRQGHPGHGPSLSLTASTRETFSPLVWEATRTPRRHSRAWGVPGPLANVFTLVPSPVLGGGWSPLPISQLE